MDRYKLIILFGFLSALGGAVRGDRLAPYEVSLHLHGEKTDQLRQLLWDASTVVVNRDHPPPSTTLLEAIARDDARKMKKILRAESFYQALVRINLKQRASGLRVYFSVTSGPPFLLSSVSIENTGPPLPIGVDLPERETLGLIPGDRGTSTAILAGESALQAYFLNAGYPAAAVTGREVVVDYARQSVAVTYRVDPGRRAVFAATRIVGLEKVREKFIRRQIPWLLGQVYDPNLVQTFRNRLARSGLFTTLLISFDDPLSAVPATVPGSPGLEEIRPLSILVTLRERNAHTVGLEAGYSTDIGFGAAVSWEDRNIFGGGELFQIRIFGSEELYYAEGKLRLPAFLHPDQSLNLAIQPVYDRPKAYDSDRVRTSAIIRREFSDVMVLSGGAALTFDRVKQFGQELEFFLFSLPLSLQLRVGGDQPFRRAGALFLLQGEPYLDLERDRYFVKTMVNGNFLYRIPGVSFLTALARVTAACIPEADLGEVPADLRYYAGGANSIRGYAYQMVGPLIGRDPVGGLSLLTGSFELNCQVLGDFGAAVFLDGGGVFAETTPRLGEEIRWGTGGGVRYFTPIGPIGLDVGFPIDRRRGIDSSFQVYVSIAQIY